MRRLIDADSLQNILLPITTALEHEYGSLGGAVSGCMKHIDNAPTVDAVPVVRCRECKHWGDEDGKSQREDGVLFARCNVHNYLIDGRHTGWCPTENDFCSYGERRGGQA